MYASPDSTECGSPLSCAIYNDIKSNNTSPDCDLNDGTRTTDSDIATLGSLSHDPGDSTCPGVNMVVEDEKDALKALSSSLSHEVHIRGHPSLVKDSSIEIEIEHTVPLLKSTIHERGTCPSGDHPNGDAHPKIDHFEYNSARVKM